jgi:hypothetical protein
MLLLLLLWSHLLQQACQQLAWHCVWMRQQQQQQLFLLQPHCCCRCYHQLTAHHPQ